MQPSLSTIDDNAFDADLSASSSDAIRIVIFTLPWSGGSQLLKGIVAQLANDYAQNERLHFLEMDADSCPRTRNRFRIGFIPTTLIFRGTSLIHQIKGVVSKHTFNQLIQPLLAGPVAISSPSRGQQT